jgi:hypothetical protein
MIELFASLVVWAHQGGCCMVPLPTSSGQKRDTLAHIWAQLSSDLQLRVIALVAELALSVLVARSHNMGEGEEARHVDAATDPQNPS